MDSIILLLSGTLAGFIDSIAGGGGLVTLPVLSMFSGPGPHAIGTNKIVGSIGALVAFFVYLRKGHVDWSSALTFGIWVGFGSFVGSNAAPFFPGSWFRWLLICVSPAILWLIWRKDLWVRTHPAPNNSERMGWDKFARPGLIAAGAATGFYDGFFGPGGGTVMFLGLYFLGRQPLLMAIAGAKLVNFISAFTALAVFSYGGYVNWPNGAVMAAGMVGGAFTGAHLASEKAATIVRPVLAVVVCLLLLRLMATA